MYLKANINLEPEISGEIENLISGQMHDALVEALIQDKNYLNKVIRDCVKGQIKSHITEILQDKNYKNFLQDKISDELGYTSKDVSENES